MDFSLIPRALASDDFWGGCDACQLPISTFNYTKLSELDIIAKKRKFHLQLPVKYMTEPAELSEQVESVKID